MIANYATGDEIQRVRLYPSPPNQIVPHMNPDTAPIPLHVWRSLDRMFSGDPSDYLDKSVDSRVPGGYHGYDICIMDIARHFLQLTPTQLQPFQGEAGCK